MKKLYEKNELTFAIIWIVVYCGLQSLANTINKVIGIEYAVSAAFCVVQVIILFAFIRKNNLQKRYGLCKSPVPACRFLYYVPMVILASGNIWNGVSLNYTSMETVCRIVCMLCVGFLEEVIFRGLLFKAIAKDNIGFLMVTIFYRGGSLFPCIIVHSAINTLSTFANNSGLTVELHLLHLAVLIVITVAYTLILIRTIPKINGNTQMIVSNIFL